MSSRRRRTLLPLLIASVVLSSSAAEAAKLANRLLQRGAYRHFERIQTRWNDNDGQQHINNAIYYEFMDNAVNNHLITGIGLEDSRNVLRFTSESSCRYYRQLSYPAMLDIGLRLRLGRSSAAYEIGIFEAGVNDAAATGTFTHVYVNERGRPIRVPEGVRSVLQALVEDAEEE